MMMKCEVACAIDDTKSICCHDCTEFKTCDESCSSNPEDCGSVVQDEETAVVPFERKQAVLINNIKDLYAQKAKLDEQDKKFKAKLKTAMEEYGIKKFEKGNLSLTYVAATKSTSVDSKKLKESRPEIFAEFSKVTNRSAYVKVTVK